MSTHSTKYCVVTATLLIAGLQCGLVAPSMAAEIRVTTHTAVPKSVGHRVDGHRVEQNDVAPNGQKQNAASKVTMKAQLQEGGFLLRWNGLPQELTATDILVDIDFYTVTGEYGGSIVENPQVSEGENRGEYSLLMSLARGKEVVYVIVLTDSINNISYEFFVKEDGRRLVQTVDPRNGKAKPTEPTVDIEHEEAETSEASPTPISGAENDQDEDNQLSPTLRDTLHPTPESSTAAPVKVPRGRYIVSEDTSVYDPQNQRKGKPRLSVQDSQGDSQDDTKPVTILGTNFAQNTSGYDLMVMEVDSEGNTVGDALAIVHVGPESISAGAFEAVIGVPGASLQIGRTYLVAAFDAAGDGNLQLNTVRFTVTQASSEGGGSSSGSSSVNEEKPVAVPSASTSETADASGANAPATGSTSKTRGIQADTAMAPGTNDATISIPRATGSSATASSSALGYRTGEAQPVEVATPESNLPSGTDSAAQSRRAAILNGSSSQVRTEPGSPNGVKATEAQITRNMDKSSPLLPILVTLGGGLILGALGMSRMHTSKKD